MAMNDVTVVLAHGAWGRWIELGTGHHGALAPDEDEKVADVFYRVEPHPQAPKLAPDRDGLIWLPAGAVDTAFAQNASADERAVLAAVQRPISGIHRGCLLCRPACRRRTAGPHR